jgi:CheY-like chemotaxis protein
MLSHEYIVVIEDDQPIREMMEAVIKAEGYGVRTACNGEEAMEILKNLDSPRLIITDLSMPIMDGYSFIELANQTDTISNIPIVVISASPLNSKIKEKIATGKIKKLIKKPVNLDYLIEVIVEYCGSPYLRLDSA